MSREGGSGGRGGPSSLSRLSVELSNSKWGMGMWGQPTAERKVCMMMPQAPTADLTSTVLNSSWETAASYASHSLTLACEQGALPHGGNHIFVKAIDSDIVLLSRLLTNTSQPDAYFHNAPVFCSYQVTRIVDASGHDRLR